MQAVPAQPEPNKIGCTAPPPPGPTDFCECGPGRPCKTGGVWTRQHPGLRIAKGDLIGDCNNGRELLNLCAARQIDTLLYMGVASNMCVQYRSMGLRNLKDHGLRVLVVADLVEAITSNGLDAQGVKNLNFTPAGGTARIQEHLERYLAATVESRQLLAAAGMAPHASDPRPHIVLVAAEAEYDSQNTLRRFAQDQLAKEFRWTLLAATGPEGTDRDDVPGLDALYDADLLVLSMRRRSLPVIQMDGLERYLRAGKPLVALRTSVVAFQTKRDPQPGYVVWDQFGQEVLGCNYQGYNPQVAGDRLRRVDPARGGPASDSGWRRSEVPQSLLDLPATASGGQRGRIADGTLVGGGSRGARRLDEHVPWRPNVLHDPRTSGRFPE